MAFPLGLWDLSLLSATATILLLTASELLSPYYGRTRLVINRKRLRIVALIVALIFLAIVTYRIYGIVTAPR
jgi:hypothetical protein